MFRAFVYHVDYEPKIIEDTVLYQAMITNGWHPTPDLAKEARARELKTLKRSGKKAVTTHVSEHSQ